MNRGVGNVMYFSSQKDDFVVLEFRENAVVREETNKWYQIISSDSVGSTLVYSHTISLYLHHSP